MRVQTVPKNEIVFSAKTGFLTRALWEEFFAPKSRSWRFRRWRNILEMGIFIPHPSKMVRDVFVLNPNNRIVKSIVGEEISCAPFVAQIEHDEAVARILLELIAIDKVEGFITEAEQKRNYESEFETKQTEAKLKFPDALIKIRTRKGLMMVALEIECTQKSQKRYRSVLEKYKTRNFVDIVIFIVNSQGMKRSIQRAKIHTEYRDATRPIGFAKLPEWLVDPCEAKIEFENFNSNFLKLAHS